MNAAAKAKLVFDVANSSIVREKIPHPFRVMVKTASGQVHTIHFGGSLEAAQASKRRFTTEFYLLRREHVERKKARPENAKFLSADENFE